MFRRALPKLQIRLRSRYEPDERVETGGNVSSQSELSALDFEKETDKSVRV
jgi:hypothetical protein